MRITLKATGVVAGTLPEAALGAGATVDVADGATPATVLADYGIDVADGYLVLVGEAVVVPSEVDTRRLADGDCLTVLPPLRGG